MTRVDNGVGSSRVCGRRLNALRAARRWRLLCGLAFCGLLVTDRAWSIRLPEAAGPHPVGTAIYFITDEERESSVGDVDGRPLSLQVWYPARASAHQIRAPYVASWELLELLAEEGYYEQDADQIAKWGGLTTHSGVNLLPVESNAELPLIVFSPGLGIVGCNYTLLAESLASFGYLVVAVGHPFAAIARDGEGRVLRLVDDQNFSDDEETNRVYEQEWAQDIRFVIDWISSGRAHISGIVDLSRVAAVGHSLGGGAAFEACRTDERLRACVSLDGFSFGATRDEGMGAPSLFVKANPDYSDEDHARRGRTREDWDAMVRRVRPQLLEPLTQNEGHPSYYVEVLGTGHMSFSDAPFVMPDTITRFGGSILSPERTLLVLSSVLRAFLGEHLQGQETGLREASLQFPEVELELITKDRGGS